MHGVEETGLKGLGMSSLHCWLRGFRALNLGAEALGWRVGVCACCPKDEQMTTYDIVTAVGEEHIWCCT